MDIEWNLRLLGIAGSEGVSLEADEWVCLEIWRRWYRHNGVLAARAESRQLLSGCQKKTEISLVRSR